MSPLEEKIMEQRHGRHTPAFLLLALAKAPAYGSMLAKQLEEELPFCFSDSAIVYRSLKEMEKNELVSATWETRDSGNPIKWYSITEKGINALIEMADDIKKRHDNFHYFLSQYELIK